MPTTTVNISNTTFVASGQPNNNMSSYSVMYVGTNPQFQDCIGLMQITLPSLPVNQVDSAFLQLAVVAKSGAASSPVVVNRVDEAFSTSTVTYSTRPSFTPTASTINVSTSDLYTIVQIDVTALISSWLNGTVPNNGLALTNSDGSTVVHFATNNIIYQPYFPTLTLTYSSSPASNTAICFSYEQLAHVITQLIQLYPSTVMTFYTTGFNVVGVTGIPIELYASPDASYGTLAVITDAGVNGAVPLNQITAIELPADAIYNQSITYLPTPQFPAGCDKNLITSWHDYLPVSTAATVYTGALISETGVVYRNEYGLLVMADNGTGLHPVFLPVVNITAVTTTAPAAAPGKTKDVSKSGLIIQGKSENYPLNHQQ